MSVDIWQIDCDGIPYKPYPGRDNSREALIGEQWVSLTDYEAKVAGLDLALKAVSGTAQEFARRIDEQERIITSYQIAKDNLELRLATALHFYGPAHSIVEPAQVY